ncbi:iron transporter [Shewanella cyperi]|uniref:Iron transporter n=1 Tax=Shewanella cyperi TaxID=2814292 RepID=A0A974XNK3_9GAMM|nr:iron transporter [Shewanella cyperi]QSX30518.1 iron transporter [Shewanella cyperi]
MKSLKLTVGALMAGLLFTSAGWAAGQAQDQITEKYGMKIWGLYIQPVLMTGGSTNLKMPLGEMADMQHMDHANMSSTDHKVEAGADIHLEAKVHALENNPYGFVKDSWIPYLKVDYRIEKAGSDWFTSGSFDPMVANDGPHYGGNVKLNGVGKYKVMFRITPPNLMLHTDKETAPSKWFEPFIVSWDMTYLGTGKKGGY